jgi:hypothetical protein
VRQVLGAVARENSGVSLQQISVSGSPPAYRGSRMNPKGDLNDPSAVGMSQFAEAVTQEMRV